MSDGSKDMDPLKTAQAGADTSSGESSGMVACIGIVAANNAPLYLRSFPCRTCELDRQQLQEVMYNSLDVVEERTAQAAGGGRGGSGGGRRSTTTGGGADLGGFVGCLAVVGPLSVFGWVTVTRRKILVAVAGGAAEQRDARVRALFRRVVAAMADRAADPFAKLDGALGGPRFERAVVEAVAWFG